MPNYRSVFISHAHADHALCDRYAAAFAQLGVPHFYDDTSPQTSHGAHETLEQALSRARALIVLASPKALRSQWVRKETDIFLDLMTHDPTRMLIPVKVAPCDLPPQMETRWWVDAVHRSPEGVAAELARALEHAPAPWPAPPLLLAQPARPTLSGGYSRVVDWRSGMGDHTTIPEAIEAAHNGERILVRKGVYIGGLTLTKSIDLVGDGLPGDVEIRASASDVIRFDAARGRIANLTLRQTGQDGEWCGVDIGGGYLELAGCDIASQSGAGVFIHDGAEAHARSLRIHDNAMIGVIISAQGKGEFEDCDIFANTLIGVEMWSGDLTMRKCLIHDTSASMSPDIAATLFSVARTDASDDTGTELVKMISGAGLIIGDGPCLLEDCDIFANARAGVMSGNAGALTVRGCRINRNGGNGVLIFERCGGIFEENDLRENAHGAWLLSGESQDKLTRRKNRE